MKRLRASAFMVWCAVCIYGSADAQTRPAYMSLRSSEVYMRVGPGKMYPVIWVYTVRGLPLEIIGKNNEWLQVRDKDGETGWVYYRLLSKVRTAIVTSNDVLLHYHPDNNAGISARLMKHVVVVPTACRRSWCKVRVASGDSTLEGWVRRLYLWGIDPADLFEE